MELCLWYVFSWPFHGTFWSPLWVRIIITKRLCHITWSRKWHEGMEFSLLICVFLVNACLLCHSCGRLKWERLRQVIASVILQDDTGFCLLQQQASSLSLSKVLERSCMRITYSQFPAIFLQSQTNFWSSWSWLVWQSTSCIAPKHFPQCTKTQLMLQWRRWSTIALCVTPVACPCLTPNSSNFWVDFSLFPGKDLLK